MKALHWSAFFAYIVAGKRIFDTNLGIFSIYRASFFLDTDGEVI